MKNKSVSGAPPIYLLESRAIQNLHLECYDDKLLVGIEQMSLINYKVKKLVVLLIMSWHPSMIVKKSLPLLFLEYMSGNLCHFT